MADLYANPFAPSSEDLKDSFRELALELSAMGAAIDVPIRAFACATLPHFGTLPLAEQQAAVMRLAQYVSICQDVVASGGSLASTRTFVWRAFRAFGWKPNSQFFDSMREDHVVEIYDVNNIQLFRNFRFFEFCSYTLEDIFTRPWTNLFVRKDQDQSDRLLTYVCTMMGNKAYETTYPEVGVQNVREADSELLNEIDLEIESMALLFDDAYQPCAFIVCERVEFAQTASVSA